MKRWLPLENLSVGIDWHMDEIRKKLLNWIDEDREEIISLFQALVRERSPNPPGDTRSACDLLKRYLDGKGLDCRIEAPNPIMPNLVASLEGNQPGRHLVLNGHLDVFPVDEEGPKWSHDPWGGELVDGRIYGRGTSDMKAGTTASVVAYCLLSRLRSQFSGRLTLTAVSDEETFGPWGAQYLLDTYPDLLGDCMLNSDACGPEAIVFGERGPLWLEFTVQTPGDHGANVHRSKSATKIAMAVAGELEALTGEVEDEEHVPHNIKSVIASGRETLDATFGQGAGDLIFQVTLNIGTIRGGTKVNMIPSSCVFETDFRLPVGMSKTDLFAKIERIVKKYPEVSWKEIGGAESSWCDPDHEMVEILQGNVEFLGKPRPKPIIALGATDTRLWRYRGTPAYVYGCSPNGMGSQDEYVDVDEFLDIVRVHTLSAFEYLAAGTRNGSGS